MNAQSIEGRYDVVVAGARAAGAATAMLLARRGLKVLVVDPARRGADTLSTHALMRGGVLQLHRWGVLDEIRAAGTPAIRTTTFDYEDERIEVAIKSRDGVDALYSPRRFVLDEVLVQAAERAGAHVVHGVSVSGLVLDEGGRVRGALLSSPDRTARSVKAELVIGADGHHSRVAREVQAEVEVGTPHATASIYGHFPNPGFEGNYWYYRPELGGGVIPTNEGLVCVFVGISSAVFDGERGRGLDSLFYRMVDRVSPELAAELRRSASRVKLRGFAGAPGYLRRAHGPGWALVGDAGYFRDPITAHGLTDALRDAELLARAVVQGTDDALAAYQATRDDLSRRLMRISDRLASVKWDLLEAKALHRELSREMNREVDHLRGLDASDFSGRPTVEAVGLPRSA